MSWTLPGVTELRPLGEGASGRVVMARHDATGTVVAVKYLSDALAADAEFRARFQREAELLGAVDSPYVTRLYEYVETPAGLAIVMEAVHGVSLRELIARTGPTGPEAALLVLKGSLLGLAAAHGSGVVHRDYKPANVLVGVAGDSRLVDFGVAARAGASGSTTGTPHYMAPEQWAGQAATPATDVYAATVTVVECLTGRPPFDAPDLRSLALQHRSAPVDLAAVPEPVRGLVELGMAKDPGRRPRDATALVARLDSVAHAAYGDGWEDRGRVALSARVATVAYLLPFDGTEIENVAHGEALPDGANGPVGAASEGSGSSGSARRRASPVDRHSRERASGAQGRRRRRRGLTAACVAALLLLGGGGTYVGIAGSRAQPAPAPDAPVQVDAVTAAVDSCTDPVATFTADLSGTPGATVRYAWVRSDGTRLPEESVVLGGDGRARVASDWERAPGPGSQTLELISPVARTSAPAEIDPACTGGNGGGPVAAAVTAVSISGLGYTADGRAGGDFTVTTDGPGEVVVTLRFGSTTTTIPLSGRTSYTRSFGAPVACGESVSASVTSVNGKGAGAGLPARDCGKPPDPCQADACLAPPPPPPPPTPDPDPEPEPDPEPQLPQSQIAVPDDAEGTVVDPGTGG